MNTHPVLQTILGNSWTTLSHTNPWTHARWAYAVKKYLYKNKTKKYFHFLKHLYNHGKTE